MRLEQALRILPLAAALWSPACISAPDQDRCAEVNGALAECLGSQSLRLDCAVASEVDVEGVAALVEDGTCEQLATLIPIDGDPSSALCKVLGVGCVAAVTPEPVHAPARYPVLLVNGIDTSPLFRYAPRIADTMRKRGGHDVHLASLPPYEPPHRRAPVLWDRIQEVLADTGADKVNLICHSLGGLDCRYLVSPGGLHWDVAADHDEIVARVASISTIGTAHWGTRVADVMLELTPDGDREQTINDFATLVGDWFSDEALAEDVHLREAIAALSIDQAPAFNAEIVDAEGIEYHSWAGVGRPFGVADGAHDHDLAELCTTSEGQPGLHGFVAHDWMALPLIPLTDVVGRHSSEDGDVLVPNDGLAAVDSARWGNFRGCVPADHMEQLGQKNLPDVNVQNGFDVARFYANVAGDLAARGF